MKNPTEIFKSGLKHPEPLVNAEAARLIGEWGIRELIPELIENARISRFYSKTTTFYALAALKAEEAIPHLTALVSEPNVSDDWYWTGYKGVRTAAAVSLLQLGSDAGLPHLLELAEKKDFVLYRWFAPALLKLKKPELLTYLTLENICDETKQKNYGPSGDYSEPGMLTVMCEALGLLNDPKATQRIEFYMGHYSRFLRGQVYRSLYLRHPDKTTAEKITANAKKHGTDFDRLVTAETHKDSATLVEIAKKAPAFFDRGSAIDSLAKIGSPDLLEAGTAALKDPELYVRQCAVEALGWRCKKDAQKALEDLAGTEKELRVLCAIAATQLGEKK